MATNMIAQKGILYPEMFRGLIEAAIFSNEATLCEDMNREYGHQPAYRGDWTPDKAGISLEDFAPSAIAYLEDYCRQFQSTFPDFCSNADRYLLTTLRGYSALEWVGHDLWMTTDRQGVGFWDGDWDEEASMPVTEWCQKHGQFWIYVGDDQLIYVSGKENYVS